MSPREPVELPDYLESASALSDFFEAQFAGLGPRERGERFANVVQLLVPLSEEGREYGPLEQRGASHDDGVDLVSAVTHDNKRLCVQSRYHLNSKKDFDSVISHFQHFEALFGDRNEAGAQRTLALDPPVRLQFMIVSASSLKGVRRSYENSSLASLAYYGDLLRERRLQVVGIEELRGLLSQSYLRRFQPPKEICIRADSGWVQNPSPSSTVRLGFVSGSALRDLHEQFGDALFFENVREFIGLQDGGDGVNESILDTIRSAPARMAERNNGVTLRGERVRVDETDLHTLIIEEAGIVNGCQTTMCLVEGVSSAEEEPFVVLKVVEAADAWDVARAANHQNHVPLRDLDVARFLRPQVLREIASRTGSGVRIEQPATAEALTGFLAEISREVIAYEDVKYVFFALFCTKPNQLFQDNYARLDGPMLEALEHAGPEAHRRLFESLFQIVVVGRESMQRCEQTFTETSNKVLARLRQSKYFSYIAILALTGILETDDLGHGHGDSSKGFTVLQQIVDEGRSIVENDRTRYREGFLDAYQVIADKAYEAWDDSADENKVRQVMSSKIDGAAFEGLRQLVTMNVQRSQRRQDSASS